MYEGNANEEYYGKSEILDKIEETWNIRGNCLCEGGKAVDIIYVGENWKQL